jgi:divalent metal cation (Fe/Co/Zn/Cd) transporter
VYNFHPAIDKIDTVRAYYSGNGLLVEVDIVLPPDTSLRMAHDIGEALQIYLESMTVVEVERAFVHLDYEWEHEIEHKKRIQYPN